MSTSKNRQDAFCKTAVKASPSRRERYLEVIDSSLQLTWQKLDSPYCPASQRPALLRCIAALVSVGSVLLRDVELEELAERLAVIERNQGAEHR